jgi:DNA-binding NtrC family response regulator
MYLPDLKQPNAPLGASETQTILLVDDNDAFRNVISTFLQAAGYKVLEARTASEASMIATRQTNSIDLLLTDVVLPGANGDQLGDHLQFLFPKISIVYMSGYGTAASFGSVGSKDGAHMLPKPFSKKTLLLAVAQLLNWKEYEGEKFVPQRAWGAYAGSAHHAV